MNKTSVDPIVASNDYKEKINRIINLTSSKILAATKETQSSCWREKINQYLGEAMEDCKDSYRLLLKEIGQIK